MEEGGPGHRAAERRLSDLNLGIQQRLLGELVRHTSLSCLRHTFLELTRLRVREIVCIFLNLSPIPEEKGVTSMKSSGKIVSKY